MVNKFLFALILLFATKLWCAPFVAQYELPFSPNSLENIYSLSTHTIIVDKDVITIPVIKTGTQESLVESMRRYEDFKEMVIGLNPYHSEIYHGHLSGKRHYHIRFKRPIDPKLLELFAKHFSLPSSLADKIIADFERHLSWRESGKSRLYNYLYVFPDSYRLDLQTTALPSSL